MTKNAPKSYMGVIETGEAKRQGKSLGLYFSDLIMTYIFQKYKKYASSHMSIACCNNSRSNLFPEIPVWINHTNDL